VQPPRHPDVARVVNDDGLEVRLAVSEDGEQPPLDVRDPAVRDCDERDGARRHWLVAWRRSFHRLQLAARGAVENVPAAGAKLLADAVGRLKIVLAPALDALC
jgi:hypothetical protein